MNRVHEIDNIVKLMFQRLLETQNIITFNRIIVAGVVKILARIGFRRT